MKKLLFLAFVAATAAPAFAQTESAATDSELKTAYCITVMQDQLSRQTTGNDTGNKAADKLFADAAAETASALNRYQSYLVPRIRHIDTSGLIAARNRATEDLKGLLPNTNACWARCGPVAGETWPACITSCTRANPLLVRLDSCNKPDWLPF